MRPFRRNSLTEKLIGVLSQLAVIGFSTLFCLWMISGARAAVAANIDLVQIRPNAGEAGVESVELEFSAELSSAAVTPSFDRDFFQLSIAGSSVFPAKTIESKDKQLKKIFSYQYEPGVTRTRFFLGKKSETMKSAVGWKVDGKKIIVTVDSSRLATSATDAIAMKVASTEKKVSTQLTQKEILTTDEEALLKAMTDRLDKREAPAATSATSSAASAGASNSATVAKVEEKKSETTEKASGDLFSGMKRDPAATQVDSNRSATGGFGKVLFNLALVLGLIAGLAWGFRKFVLKKGLALGAQNSLIRPISSYSLSPGRSLSIVRIGDEVLVLGVTNSNISLITTLGPDSGIDKFLEPKKGSSKKSFEGLLNREIDRFDVDSSIVDGETTESKPNATIVGRAIESLGVRELIRDKVRGFKQLS